MVPRTDLYLLDLFSGIGGFSVALNKVCTTIAYCDSDVRARNVLYERMKHKQLSTAPVFTDVKKINGKDLVKRLQKDVDVVSAGFPCQDVSVMNIHGLGIKGKISTLVFEAIRISDEVGASILILENSPNLKNRGLVAVLSALKENGFTEHRWGIFAASDIGAPQNRKRLYLVAVRKGTRAKRVLTDMQLQLKKSVTMMIQQSDWWTKIPSPPRVIKKTWCNLEQLEERGYLLGNSIVPWCALHAIYVLESQLLETDYKLDIQPARKHCDIVVEVPDSKTDYPGAVFNFKNWATPLATWWKISRVNSSRASGILPNQILYEKRTKIYMERHGDPKNIGFQYEHWIVNPMFIEWLMGYPFGWTQTSVTD